MNANFFASEQPFLLESWPGKNKTFLEDLSMRSDDDNVTIWHQRDNKKVLKVTG